MYVVVITKQQRQAWKIPNQVWNDALFKNSKNKA